MMGCKMEGKLHKYVSRLQIMCMASTEYGGFLLVRKNFYIKTKFPPSSRTSNCGKYDVLAEQKISSNSVLYVFVPNTYTLIQ